MLPGTSRCFKVTPPPLHAHLMCGGRVEGQGSPEHIKDILYDTPYNYEQLAFGLEM